MSNVANVRIQLSNGDEAGRTINELTAQSAKLAREIKKLEVGSDEWVTASQDFQKISGHLKNVRKEAFDTAKAQDELNSMFADMVPFQSEFQKLSVGVKGVGAAFRATSSMAQLLKVALASTGIGLLVVALGSLVAWLTKTQKGMDFVGKVTSAAGAAFQVIIDRALSFASAMANLVTGNFGAALNDLKSTFQGLGQEIASETAAAYEMTGAMQDIVRAEKQIELQRSRSRAELERLKMVAEDQTKTDQERLNAAQTAFNLENKLLADSIALQEKKLKIIRDQNALGTSTDEDLNREYDTEIELNNLREESFTKQTELQNKINELKRSGAVVAKELVKEVAEEEFFVVSENLEKEIAALDAQIGKEIEATRKAEEEKAKLREEAISGRMEQLDRQFELEQMKLDEQFFNGQITEEERRQLAFEQEKAFLEQRLTEMALLGETEVAVYQDMYTRLAQLHYEHESEKTKQTEENEKKRKELMTAGLSAAAGIFAGLATLLSENAKARKKNFAVLKAVQAAEIAANTVTEVSNIWKSVTATFPQPFASIIGAVQTALAVARGASAISRINSTQISGGESFADGGPVFGKSHRNGGIKFLAGGQMNEMEGGEIILTKGVYQDPVLRSFASMINQMGGGRSFAMGGPVSSGLSAASPMTASVPGVPSSGGLFNTKTLEEQMAEQNALLRIIAQKPVLALTQIKDGLESLYDVENDATF
jgi:hypothetical protein